VIVIKIIVIFSIIVQCFINYSLDGIDMTNSSNVVTAPYGTWKSPITAEKIAAGVTTTLNMLVEGDKTYWCEMRPTNKGRYTIVCRDGSGNLMDVTSPDFNVRTFVHEYGGGAFTVDKGILYASNAIDHALYTIQPGSSPVRLTQGQTRVDGTSLWQGTRFADMQPSSFGLIAVGEHHEPGKPVENFLALIDTSTGEYKKLSSGCDFYSSPTISFDEKKVAWICWNHPDMPWTNTELWMADFNGENLENIQKVAGHIPEAIFQPQWSRDGILYFVTDRDRGWWNIHRFVENRIENVCPLASEAAVPLWVFGRSTYAFLDHQILFTYNAAGKWNLGILDPKTKQWEKLPYESNTIDQVRGGGGFIRFLAGFPNKQEALIQVDDVSGYPIKVLHAKENLVEDGYISKGQHISFPSNGRKAFGFYYPPYNKDFTAPSDQKPPLVVTIHGGPTSQAFSSLNLGIQYWTSRGFAVLDVNYGGSTGYGRDFRQLLDRNWGIVDVDDCVNGALYLAQRGLVDPNKLVIRGRSAGGYTTLAALAFRDVFKAGADYFGVADITALAHDTHKFEQRYMEQLVGKYPEEKAVWEKRSPINSVSNIKSPLIIFQGEEDPIVPKNQSIMLFEALKQRGVTVELHLYPGEQHGFRQAPHIIHSLMRELDFYLEVL
jgi:dipeptidyl aminopeptidase/acylaminoacyl peptidase